MKTTKKQILEVYSEKGLLGVRALLRRNKTAFTESVEHFGLETNRNARSSKFNFLSEKTDKNTVRFHYYSILVRSRSGWSYNKIRAVEIKLL